MQKHVTGSQENFVISIMNKLVLVLLWNKIFILGLRKRTKAECLLSFDSKSNSTISAFNICHETKEIYLLILLAHA
jgi:hypothetical protein